MIEPEANGQLEQLYRDLILDHARAPRNFQPIADATHTAEGINPVCGDKLRLYLLVDEQSRVVQTGFEGSGCAISMASASLLTETISNLSVSEAEAYFDAVIQALAGPEPAVPSPQSKLDLTKLNALRGVRQYPSRVKCATLAWHALHAALNTPDHTATTE